MGIPEQHRRSTITEQKNEEKPKRKIKSNRWNTREENEGECMVRK